MESTMRAERRFGWIEASLRFSGSFGVPEKKAFRSVFGLTDSMVSRDQTAFIAAFNEVNGRVAVRKRQGRLEAVEDTPMPPKPTFPMPTLARWLADLLGERFHEVPAIQRAGPRFEVLRPVLQAMSQRRMLFMHYISRKGGHGRRTVSPHRIVLVAGRMHLRAWDHERNAARDFVLSRVVHASVLPERFFVRPEQDGEWSKQVTIEIRANEGEDAAAIRCDFNLDEFGVARRKVRAADARYLVSNPRDASKAGLASPVTVRQVDVTE